MTIDEFLEAMPRVNGVWGLQARGHAWAWAGRLYCDIVSPERHCEGRSWPYEPTAAVAASRGVFVIDKHSGANCQRAAAALGLVGAAYEAIWQAVGVGYSGYSWDRELRARMLAAVGLQELSTRQSWPAWGHPAVRNSDGRESRCVRAMASACCGW